MLEKDLEILNNGLAKLPMKKINLIINDLKNNKEVDNSIINLLETKYSKNEIYKTTINQIGGNKEFEPFQNYIETQTKEHSNVFNKINEARENIKELKERIKNLKENIKKNENKSKEQKNKNKSESEKLNKKNKTMKDKSEKEFKTAIDSQQKELNKNKKDWKEMMKDLDKIAEKIQKIIKTEVKKQKKDEKAKKNKKNNKYYSESTDILDEIFKNI